MPSQRILIIGVPLTSPGGIANYYRVALRHFRARDIHLQYVALGGEGVRLRREQGLFGWIRCRVVQVRTLLAVALLAKTYRAVILNPSLRPFPLLREGALLVLFKLLRRQVVVSIRGWSDHVAARLEGERSLRLLFRTIYGSADHVIIQAERFRAKLCAIGLHRERLSVIRTAADPPSWCEPRRSRPTGRIKFIYMGRVAFDKGIDEILTAAAMLKRTQFAFEIDICGEPESERTEQFLLDKVRMHGLDSFVNLHGYVSGERKWRLLCAAHVFLFPSVHHEGCPNAVAEAMAAGLFIVATDVGALPELIVPGESGFLIERRSPQALASAMKTVCQNPSLLVAGGERNQRVAMETMSAQSLVAQLEALFRKIASDGNSDG